ncbi:SRPBCC family protein [Leifsonia shinshuensis]|uniref:SRPBCC family protein n=1 Tax=Leifsonia shinshuensis TaxID=150026 RepID=UPI002855B2C1|nr:SRPBCC family protein [Leifsonia shinshuensis]MDR6972773.1 putative membrane protein [Leifsonia shinshuensis]
MSAPRPAGIVAEVDIRRPVAEVYAFLRDPRNLPRFLGDVLAVEVLGPLRSRWTVGLPLGMRIHWTAEVVEDVPGELFSYRTRTAGRVTTWRYTFQPGEASTLVREQLTMPGGNLARLALRLARKHPADEVRSNLHRLKQLLETGTVTDTSNALPGRF